MVVQEGEGVADVLLVELDDLELRKQELRQRDGERLHGHTVAEGDLVAHPEVADEDVDLPVVPLVEEEQPLPAVHRVEPRLRNVPQGLEEPLRLGGFALRCDPIQVRVLPLEAGARPSRARTLTATPPSRRSATSWRSASSVTRTASSTMSALISLFSLLVTTPPVLS